MSEKVTRYCALFVRLRDGGRGIVVFFWGVGGGGGGGMERIGLDVLA